jgi:hypothetical protein
MVPNVGGMGAYTGARVFRRTSEMRQPERFTGEILPYSSISPIVVVRELCRVAKRARALYVSNDWQFVLRNLTAQSRVEAAQALRFVAFVAQSIAESLEKKRGDENEPPTNYGLQRWLAVEREETA